MSYNLLLIFWSNAPAAVYMVNNLPAVARWRSKSLIIPLLGNGDPFMGLISLLCLGGGTIIRDAFTMSAENFNHSWQNASK